MVDETLKRLLEAEAKAEQTIARAEQERQSIIELARAEAHAAEQHHAERVTQIHASFLAEAEQRAQQTISTLQQRYAEHAHALRAAAEHQEQQALDAALALFTGSGRS